MNAKVARRLLKLGSVANKLAFTFIQMVLGKAKSIIDTRWSNLREKTEHVHDLSRLKKLEFDEDTLHHLPTLDDFLKSIVKREKTAKFTDFRPSRRLAKYHADELPILSNPPDTDYLATT